MKIYLSDHEPDNEHPLNCGTCMWFSEYYDVSSHGTCKLVENCTDDDDDVPFLHESSSGDLTAELVVARVFGCVGWLALWK